MIDARCLTKRYGDTVAVDDLSFTVRPGVVTGFLGPNGAGKSTTMRLLMGLDSPDSGSVRVNSRRYHELAWPLREVGALLILAAPADAPMVHALVDVSDGAVIVGDVVPAEVSVAQSLAWVRPRPGAAPAPVEAETTTAGVRCRAAGSSARSHVAARRVPRDPSTPSNARERAPRRLDSAALGR